MPLPFREDVPIYPDAPYYGANRIDHSMNQETADLTEKQHPNMSYLGQGNIGVAYDAGDRVIKITSDPTEYRAALQQFENPIPCLVNCLAPPEIIQKHDNDPNKIIYKLTLEKVYPLTEDEFEILDAYLDESEFEDTDDYDDYSIVQECKKLMDEFVAYNVRVPDAHAGNIGRNNAGRLVLLDLGGSRRING